MISSRPSGTSPLLPSAAAGQHQAFRSKHDALCILLLLVELLQNYNFLRKEAEQNRDGDRRQEDMTNQKEDSHATLEPPG